MVHSRSTRKRKTSMTAKARPDSLESPSSNGTTGVAVKEEIAIPSVEVTVIIHSVEVTDLNTHPVMAIGSAKIAAKTTSLAIRSVSDARKLLLQALAENKTSPHVRVTGHATIVATITSPGEANVTSVRKQDQEVSLKELDGNRSAVVVLEVDAEVCVEDAAEIEVVAAVASTKVSNLAADQLTRKSNLIKSFNYDKHFIINNHTIP